jgi:hypothetical protein
MDWHGTLPMCVSAIAAAAAAADDDDDVRPHRQCVNTLCLQEYAAKDPASFSFGGPLKQPTSIEMRSKLVSAQRQQY